MSARNTRSSALALLLFLAAAPRVAFAKNCCSQRGVSYCVGDTVLILDDGQLESTSPLGMINEVTKSSGRGCALGTRHGGQGIPERDVGVTYEPSQLRKVVAKEDACLWDGRVCKGDTVWIKNQPHDSGTLDTVYFLDGRPVGARISQPGKKHSWVTGMSLLEPPSASARATEAGSESAGTRLADEPALPTSSK